MYAGWWIQTSFCNSFLILFLLYFIVFHFQPYPRLKRRVLKQFYLTSVRAFHSTASKKPLPATSVQSDGPPTEETDESKPLLAGKRTVLIFSAHEIFILESHST